MPETPEQRRTLIRLNEALPMVSAAAALTAAPKGSTEYQTQLKKALSIFLSAEKTHRLYFSPYIRTNANCIVPIASSEKIDIEELGPELRRLEKSNAWASKYRQGQIEDDGTGFFIHEGGLFGKHLNPFLSETEFLIQGFSGSIIFPGGQICSFSQREWGNFIARWANSKGWHTAERQQRGGKWSYVDFYTHADSFIEGYREFERGFLTVLGEAWRRQGLLE